MRARIGRWMRKWADRIDDHGAPKLTNYSFTFETGEGIRFRDDRRGCRIAYLGDDEYDKAHTEADSAEADAVSDRRRRLIEVAMGADDPEEARAAMLELRKEWQL
ncbi:hypothetical protein [Nocardia nova]|uniref:hypothetical protein n=1 Tax=Nocardia nova TaxID=37330 RepID=UPI00273A53B6|nr:hypothetical protein [Nocardia nova]